MKLRSRKERRYRRHLRVRKKVRGTAERPRMCVYVSRRHIYVQFVDDQAGRTLAAASTLTGGERKGVSVAVAREVGRRAAEQARQRGIEHVVFDRGGFRYGARLKALADAAREAGLKF